MNVKAAALALLCGVLSAASAQSQVIRGGVADADAVVAPVDEQVSSTGVHGNAKVDGNRRLLTPYFGVPLESQYSPFSVISAGYLFEGALVWVQGQAGEPLTASSIKFFQATITPTQYRNTIEAGLYAATLTYNGDLGGAPTLIARYQGNVITTKKSKKGNGFEHELNGILILPKGFKQNAEYSAALADTKMVFAAAYAAFEPTLKDTGFIGLLLGKTKLHDD